jgi:hypothetical protein
VRSRRRSLSRRRASDDANLAIAQVACGASGLEEPVPEHIQCARDALYRDGCRAREKFENLLRLVAKSGKIDNVRSCTQPEVCDVKRCEIRVMTSHVALKSLNQICKLGIRIGPRWVIQDRSAEPFIAELDGLQSTMWQIAPSRAYHAIQDSERRKLQLPFCDNFA